ncbi:MAG: 6-carboxytetrahydropterin synthase QueD [Treponema sp.]|jgi:6-pyruvoyltetrahydropterin/6-carboxytetrahydropterin synthase|nr:6-carboxytetrahydropterin synthase QueD [Treponema sp.]
MYAGRVEADFAAAHFLSHYHGKCERLHGHNYRVRLYVRGDTLDSGGMLADFALLKRCLKAALAPLDHTNLNDMAVFMQNPSAERIARYIFEQIEHALPACNIKPELLHAVEVFETPVNMARYER